ncbi:nuclear fragile X mental retardation protein interacting protein 1 [Geranomyces variabilis]|nr:nuclear fragile X mental retardation protein interacting protein 1 [Geranomyces variabilis]
MDNNCSSASSSSSGFPAAAAASAYANYMLPSAWRGGAGGGDRGSRRASGRGGSRGRGGGRGGRGGGGGGFYNPRHEPYPRDHTAKYPSDPYHEQPQQQYAPYAPQQQQQQQHEMMMSQQMYGNFQQATATPLVVEQTQHALLQQQQQQLMEQQRNNLALLPAALSAMAGHFSGLLQQQQQQQQQQQMHQQQQYHYPDYSSPYPQHQAYQTAYGSAYAPSSSSPSATTGAGPLYPGFTTTTSLSSSSSSDPPPRFRCEGCDKAFHIESQYRTHCETHVKCDHCDFRASQRVVRTHAETVHAEILESAKPAYVSKDSPEEIAQWIADRKKKYPTEANILARQAEMEARIARGELPDHATKKLRGSKHSRSAARGDKKKSAVGVVDAPTTTTTTTTTTTATTATAATGLGLLAGYASDISDGEGKHKDSDADSDSGSTSDGLSDLDSSSSASDNDDDDGGKESITATRTPQPQTRRGPICRYFKMKRCRKGDACQFRHELPPPRSKTDSQKQQQQLHQQGRQAAEYNRKPLLKMLLENDIRREKSVVLQCIRYLLQTTSA